MADNGKDQLAIFDLPEPWEEDWQDMPEFVQEDQTSYRQIIVHFATREDLQAFAELIGQPLTYNTRSIWHPRAEIGRYSDKLYIDDTGDVPDELPDFEDYELWARGEEE